MNEHDFQWRRQMRDLSGPVQPQRDLWLDIAARIQTEAAAAPAPRPAFRRWALPFAAAASVALAVLVAALSHNPAVPPAPQQASVKTDPAAALAQLDQQFKQVRTQDPRLAAAAVELDAAADEIRQMLQQQPDAVFLVGLLNRTNERRLKLARMGLASS
ncbi:hypothetical protein [Tahibacter harae]|uniref:Anti-sigma factor n=1 Tax=Tahibacter harae TaxID=2963937 RepID=A0ABT1QQF1_9GAMM|nr:hypothetical protein [Tahibacter harae]MCQ4164502.1 hypothetical protein [Tahibacter harae]